MKMAKRPANPGERILIVRPFYTRRQYAKGDVLLVRESEAARFGCVYAEGVSYSIGPSEYEVFSVEDILNAALKGAE